MWKENFSLCPQSRKNTHNEHWKDIVDNWLERLDRIKIHLQKIENLSGGMKQRVALGRVMCSQPQLLLLDEPFASLHKELRQELWETINQITAQENMITLLASHHIFFFEYKSKSSSIDRDC